MFVRRYTLAALCGAGLLLAVAGAGFAQTNSKEIMALPQDQLIEILKNPAAPQFDKAKACQRLAVSGTKDAIPALVALLPDETMNVYARFGLEGIPDPAVDEALRAATATLKGRALVGVIGSIGQRQDAKAVDALKGLLADGDKQVASAAAGALGRIGTSEAAAVLKDGLARSLACKKCVGDGCLACAEGLAAAGNKAEALALYEAVVKSDLPKHQKLAAQAGQFRLRGVEAKDQLLAQLHVEDDYMFNLALAVARRMPGADVTAALVAEMDKLPPARQALLLRALGDRQDRVPLAVVVAASKSAAPVVGEAAVRVLAQIADPSTVPVLLEAALGEGDAAEAAREGLKTLPGQEADAAIADRLSAAGKGRPILIELAGARRVAAAQPIVRKALEDADAEVRLAAIAAMAQFVELADIDLLAGRALGTSADKQAAQAALKTACLRMADRDATAAHLAALIKSASADDQSDLLDLLGKVSGPKALEIVVAATRSDDPAMKDNATRVLGDWVNADAGPALLEIAKNDPDRKYQVRALRGYIRIARQLQLADEARLAMFQTALQTASRKDERQLAMDILTRVPTAASLELAVSHLGDRELKNQAADAAVKVSMKLLVSDPKAVAAAMQKVIDAAPGGLHLTRAQELLGQAQSRIKQ